MYKFAGVSLPQSASLTAPSSEGAKSPPPYCKKRFLDYTVNVFTYALKILIHIQITDPQHLQAHTFQSFCPFTIFPGLFLTVMFAAVQLHDEPGLGTIKIRDIISNRFLPLKAHRIMTQIFVPKLSFPRRHIPAQFPRKRNVFFIVRLHSGASRYFSRNSSNSISSLISSPRSPAKDSMWWVNSWARVVYSSSYSSSSPASANRAAKEP